MSAKGPRWWWSNKRRWAYHDSLRARPLSAEQRREDAWMDLMGEAHDRAVMPCLDCEVGEPHACERAWWQQQLDHYAGHECADSECLCHEAAELARQAYLLRPTSYLAAAVRGGS